MPRRSTTRARSAGLPARLLLSLVFVVLGAVLSGHGLDSHAVAEHTAAVAAGAESAAHTGSADASFSASATTSSGLTTPDGLTAVIAAPTSTVAAQAPGLGGGHGGAAGLCLFILGAFALYLTLPSRRVGVVPALRRSGLAVRSVWVSRVPVPPSLTALGVCRT